MRDFTPYDRRNGPRAAHAPDARSPAPALHHARAVLDLLLGPAASRPFDVRYWDGTVERGHASPPPFTVVVARPSALRRALLPPNELKLTEAYLAGDLDVAGPLASAISLGDALSARLRALRSPRAVARLTRHLLALPSRDDAPPTDVRAASAERVVSAQGREHEPARDAAAIRYHYDVGNDFYQLWLDQRMVYSCAYYRTPNDSLDEAQLAKLDLVCRKLRLHAGQRFLDVGCGWGALLMHAAEHYGVDATGVTLSAEQAALARARIAAAGLADRCRVELRDYRTLGTGVEPPFDRVASVGMVEHVGVERLPGYFAALHRALAPGGLLLNHGIVSVAAARPRDWKARLEHRLWKRNAFIERYVFPDGRLGPLHEVIAAAEGAGFETRDVESLREHYALTLDAWLARLDARAAEAEAVSDARTVRTWRLYMTGAAHGFASGRLNVVQTLLAKPVHGRAGLPLTREDLYKARPPARTLSETA